MLIGLAVIVALFTLLWLASLYLENSSIVDMWWGPGILMIALAYYFTSNGAPVRARLTLALVAIWAIRLAVHIGKRNIGQGEDFRYERWREQRGSSWWWFSYIKVFLPQALMAWLVSMPLYFAIVSIVPRTLTAVDVAGILLFVAGFAFEAVGDEQLRRFRDQPRNHKHVLETGLWRYSRHPNYFGEAVLWWGLGLIGTATGGVVGLIGPAAITFFLMRGSSVVLERALLERKPAYANYVATTSAFVPQRPKHTPV